jgi:hypothetical protein
MNPARWLAPPFILTALAGCAPVTTGQKQAPNAPYSLDPNGNILATWAVMAAAAVRCKQAGVGDPRTEPRDRRCST